MDVSRHDVLTTTAVTDAVATLGPAAAPADAGPAPGSEFGTTRVIPGRCHECHPQCPLLVHVHLGRRPPVAAIGPRQTWFGPIELGVPIAFFSREMRCSV